MYNSKSIQYAYPNSGLLGTKIEETSLLPEAGEDWTISISYPGPEAKFGEDSAHLLIQNS